MAAEVIREYRVVGGVGGLLKEATHRQPPAGICDHLTEGAVAHLPAGVGEALAFGGFAPLAEVDAFEFCRSLTSVVRGESARVALTSYVVLFVSYRQREKSTIIF